MSDIYSERGGEMTPFVNKTFRCDACKANGLGWCESHVTYNPEESKGTPSCTYGFDFDEWYEVK